MPKGDRYQVPKTPEQVLKRIMNDFSKSRRRCEEVFKANGEQPKYPHVDYEELRKIVQDNFGYLGVKVRHWKRNNTQFTWQTQLNTDLPKTKICRLEFRNFF